MYVEFILQICMYAKTIRILSKGSLPVSLVPPSKLQEILMQLKRPFGQQIQTMI